MTRLLQGVKRRGVNTALLTRAVGVDFGGQLMPLTIFEAVMAKLSTRFDYDLVDRYLSGVPGWWSLNLIPNSTRKRITELDPELIHLHWIGDGFLPLWSLGRVSVPVIWTLHDAWGFTGGCHYFQDCVKYVTGCGQCPQISSQRMPDISRFVSNQKAKGVASCNPVVVAPSRWLAECARKSSVFSNCRIEIIPNGIDTELFRPLDKKAVRQLLQLPHDKKIILYGAMGGRSNLLKGYALFEQSLHHLALLTIRNEIAVVSFGEQRADAVTEISGFQAIQCGILRDELSLSMLYSAADLFVLPSLQDNLPNTVMEALACGTPVVCFRSGGVVDMVEHEQNGFIAENFCPVELARGIASVLKMDGHHQRLSTNARSTACSKFDLNSVADRYTRLYRELLQQQ